MAGATHSASAHCAAVMWASSPLPVAPRYSSWWTGWPLSTSRVSGVMNALPERVSAQRTSWPSARSRRTSSAAL